MHLETSKPVQPPITTQVCVGPAIHRVTITRSIHKDATIAHWMDSNIAVSPSLWVEIKFENGQTREVPAFTVPESGAPTVCIHPFENKSSKL